MSVSTIVSYCNNDFQFLEESLIQVSKFSNEIFISFCEYGFDGEPEDKDILNKMFGLAEKYSALPVRIEFDKEKNAKYHHNLMRYEPLSVVNNDYILYLDADEIIEGEDLAQFIKSDEYKNWDVISFNCYWYFREKNYRATKLENAGVLLKKEICTPDYIFSEAERWEFFNRLHYKIIINFCYNNKVLMHHYSWVRNKEQMLKKVRSWGHKSDKDWEGLIEEEFSREFNGTDFIHNYNYEIL
jgi:hypothetical protein